MGINRFSEIEQFRNVIKDVTYHCTHHADGSLIHAPVYPKIRFEGTVKLHGTNAGIEVQGDRIRYQSRNNYITPQGDNLGFATFMSQHEDSIRRVIQQLKDGGADITDETKVIIYGEWAGPGIQKNVAISFIPDKSFFVFAIQIGDEWLPLEKMVGFYDLTARIYNIRAFKTFSVEIDFANPALVQNELIAITQAVEAECPVASALGISGTGEGVVWAADVQLKHGSPKARLIFKVKGEKHSVSKVKTLAAVDVEKLNSVMAFVDMAVTENRLNQGLDQMRQDGVDATDIRNIGKFLKWVANDVFKEEGDTMRANNLAEKDVGKAVSDRAKRWLIANHIQTFIPNRVPTRIPNEKTVEAIEAAERGEVRPFTIPRE